MKKHPGAEDNFASTAITFLLGVIIGFILLLMGFIFLFMALISTKTDEFFISTGWYIGIGLGSMAIGIVMMRYFLKSSPPPGTYR